METVVILLCSLIQKERNRKNMDELLELLKDTMARHPIFEVRDAVKFIFQNEMGPEHLIPSKQWALPRLQSELESCAENGEPECEKLGNDIYRLSLPAVREKLTAETICSMFAMTGKMVAGDKEKLKEKLQLCYELGLNKEDVDEFLGECEKAGYPAVSHSDAYRNAYAPSYRLIHRRFVEILPVLMKIDELLGGNKETIIIGIDGDCTSGKSTLGELLSEVYDGNLFHADDYFLPPEKRTAERLSEPGGNMERERLKSEVLEPLKNGSELITRRFNCGTMTLCDPVAHEKKRVNIVEGSYSLHPELADFYDLKIAMSVEPELQQKRIKDRDGEKSLKAFNEKWIPMEKRYFSHFNIFESADIRL
jgi:uridine kinase